MTLAMIGLIILIGFLAASYGAIAGGNSLLTVPALILMGVDPTVAIASNMFGITFLCIGATVRFSRSSHLQTHPTILLFLLAIPGSLLGAEITLSLAPETLKGIIVAALLAIILFLLFKPAFGAEKSNPKKLVKSIGWVSTSLWAIYGGLFSGGYTTVLTIALVYFFGITLMQSVASTKVINLGSSAAATILFALGGAIDFQIAIPLACSMLAGGFFGAHLATRIGHTWVRRSMIIIVSLLTVFMGISLLSN